MSISSVKRSLVVVAWREGLHLRPASGLVRLAHTFRSSIWLRCGEKTANLRSILSVMALCAAMGTPLDVEASGDDEQEAVAAVEQAFDVEGPEAASPRTR